MNYSKAPLAPTVINNYYGINSAALIRTLFLILTSTLMIWYAPICGQWLVANENLVHLSLRGHGFYELDKFYTQAIPTTLHVLAVWKFPFSIGHLVPYLVTVWWIFEVYYLLVFIKWLLLKIGEFIYLILEGMLSTISLIFTTIWEHRVEIKNAYIAGYRQGATWRKQAWKWIAKRRRKS